MKPVSFVRTRPATLGQQADQDAAVCVACGSVYQDECGETSEGGYQNPLSLDALFVRHPHATYFMQVGAHGDTVQYENTYLGVRTGDILTVDRTLCPVVGSLVLAVCDGELVLCRFTEHDGRRFLVCGDKREQPVEVTSEHGVRIWGVVAAMSRRLT